ncbi:MAG: hypothetical protein EHM79_00960 [Geobacter sp.]|nr:MAG: hypothetical protein EHM79_00960 [Geobacter sp.]
MDEDLGTRLTLRGSIGSSMKRTIRGSSFIGFMGKPAGTCVSMCVLSVLCIGWALGISAPVFGQQQQAIDSTASPPVLAIAPAGQGHEVEEAVATWSRLSLERSHVLLIVLIFFLLVLLFTHRARKGTGLDVRDIPGIRAMAGAVERAATLGKPIVYVPGVFDIDNIQTIASMAILVEVARETARQGVRLIVPLNRAFLIPLAEESVRRGMSEAGNAGLFDRNDIRYLSDDHFAYAAAVDGIILRERPAACLYMGGFGAESLILAETGYIAGAVQIAGTAETQQLPFLVVACDQALIGEEFYAASAYISREPTLLGTLQAADILKAIVIIILLAGSILELCGCHILSAWFTVQ